MKIKKKYQFHVLTWGGFYNEGYQIIHGQVPGDRVFDTKEEREAYISSLKVIEEKMNARVLMVHCSDGFDCYTRTVLHRVSEFRGESIYSEYDLGVNFPYDTAQYHLENKWYPGHNDYPFGEDFDYDNKEFKIVSEWITGAFTQGEPEWGFYNEN